MSIYRNLDRIPNYRISESVNTKIFLDNNRVYYIHETSPIKLKKFINNILYHDYQVIVYNETLAYFISRKMILKLDTLSYNNTTIEYKHIQSVLVYEYYNDEDVSFDNHRLYISKEFSNDMIIKWVLKTMDNVITQDNVTVAYRNLKISDVLLYPRERLTFTKVDSILDVMRKIYYIPPPVVEEVPEEVVFEPVTVIAHQEIGEPAIDLSDYMSVMNSPFTVNVVEAEILEIDYDEVPSQHLLV